MTFFWITNFALFRCFVDQAWSHDGSRWYDLYVSCAKKDSIRIVSLTYM